VLTYHLYRAKSHWAVRCFYRDVPDLRRRYDAIGRFVKTCADGVFVDATLLQDGIRVGSRYYPIIKMAWVEGYPLNVYIERNISNKDSIAWLPSAFLELANRLQSLGVAHGDLQHGNIMVTDGSLRLIDYDGLYLPELKGLPNNQRGHPNYQHPFRLDEFDANIDRFSEIAIYVALSALAESPSLWNKHSNGENLLFTQADFTDPDASLVIAELESIPKLALLGAKFRALCSLSIQDIPALDEFLSERYSVPVVARKPVRVAPRAIYEVVEASDIVDLLAKVGHRVTVIGQITDVSQGLTRYNQPYVFINFGDWRRNCFTLVVWSQVLDLFDNANVIPSRYIGKWVSVTGIVSSYKNRPQMEIEMPSQIEVLSGKQQALTRIKEPVIPTVRRAPAVPTPKIPARHVRPAPPKASSPPQMTGQDVDALRRLYGHLPTGPAPSQAQPVPYVPAQIPRKRGRIPSPGLFAGGFLLIVLALGAAVYGLYPLSLIVVTLGAFATYFGLTHYSILVPVRTVGHTFAAHFRGRCRGCSGMIQPGEAIVKTERGWMHSRCAAKAKKRIWRKA